MGIQKHGCDAGSFKAFFPPIWEYQNIFIMWVDVLCSQRSQVTFEILEICIAFYMESLSFRILTLNSVLKIPAKLNISLHKL